jgi:hypothetical protein
LKEQITTMTSVPMVEGVKEGYCTKCDGVYTPTYTQKEPVVEGFCSSCSGM